MSMQPAIIRYANIISKVLKVDVEIADSNLIRVAGTGKYGDFINASIEMEGNVYKNSMESRRPFVVENPGKSEICRECQSRGRCTEKFEACTPIKSGQEVIGVIGLVCFNDAQKLHIKSDFDTYMEFLQQVSDFISISVSEKVDKMKDENNFDRMVIFKDMKSLRQTVRSCSNDGRRILCSDILGETPVIRELKRDIKKISNSMSTVLITGESGTGKEMFARAIHNEGTRQGGPFVAINCGAIPYELLESELFGYVKGAFTGASPGGRMGKFELANGGTIFLDEIGDMPISLQVKLLRVLQEKKIVRIGANRPVDIDARVIASTNRDISDLIEQNKFRQDLYYRLNVIPFNIPPLRERIEDIETLVSYFVEKYSAILHKSISYIDQNVFDIFKGYSWPGNVRELENTIEFMMNMMDDGGRFDTALIPKNMQHESKNTSNNSFEIQNLKDLEKNEIVKALNIYGRSTNGKITASQKLGIGIATLYRKMEEYHLK